MGFIQQRACLRAGHTLSGIGFVPWGKVPVAVLLSSLGFGVCYLSHGSDILQGLPKYLCNRQYRLKNKRPT